MVHALFLTENYLLLVDLPCIEALLPVLGEGMERLIRYDGGILALFGG